MQFPCTLVAGSPGVGKTVLLSSWVEERPQARCAWLSCDRWDHDEFRFWTSIASALAAVEPGGASDALDLLAEGPDDIGDVVAALVNELAVWSGSTWLILDDLHDVAPSDLGGLVTLVERLPPTSHVVFGTRVDPVLPIQRWRARGQLAEIRDADLRLEEEHVNSFIHQYGLDLSSGDVHTLATRTEGWMAGVQLAALSLQHDSDDPSSFIRRLDGTEHVVADFLIEEVLDRQLPKWWNSWTQRRSLMSSMWNWRFAARRRARRLPPAASDELGALCHGCRTRPASLPLPPALSTNSPRPVGVRGSGPGDCPALAGG